LDAAFDVLVPEFGIEKRVHVDQMPIDVSLNRKSRSTSLKTSFTESCL
jgi:protein SSD1